MDFFLTQTYRKIYHDIVLMYDLAVYCQKKNLKGSFLNNFAEGLAAVISAEDAVADVPVPVTTSGALETEQEKKQIQWELLMEFLHSVVLQFSFEELSQYPYWAAKIATSITDDSLTTTELGRKMTVFQASLSAVAGLFGSIFNTLWWNGPIALYEGCLPFLSAAIIYNFAQLQSSVQRFSVTMMSTIAQPPIRKSSSKAALPALEAPGSGNSKSAKRVVQKEAFSVQGFLMKSFCYIATQPFLLLSVKIVADPMLRRRNWFYSCMHIVKREGPLGLFAGLRNTALLSMFPFTPFLLLGVPETILYHVLLNGNVMSAGARDSLLVATKDVLAAKGISGILIYGVMTAAQAIPGFLSFLSTRFSLWMVFGTTKQRKRQFNRRRQLLDDHFAQPVQRVTSAVNFQSAPVDGDTPRMRR